MQHQGPLELCSAQPSCTLLILARPNTKLKSKLKYRNVSDVFWEAISTCQVLSLYQGLWSKNLQSFLSSFIYFYGYSFFKRLYLEKSGNKTMGTRVDLLVATAAGACTVIVTQVFQCIYLISVRWVFPQLHLVALAMFMVVMNFTFQPFLPFLLLSLWVLSIQNKLDMIYSIQL